METVTLDFETFYDPKGGYTLRKMTTEEYINSDLFFAHGVAIKVGERPSVWVPSHLVTAAFERLNLHEKRVICHNAAFDLAILNWRYGIRPKVIYDTMAMARAVLGTTEPVNLKDLAIRFGLQQKGTELASMEGVRWLTPEQNEAMGRYARGDVDITYALFHKLLPGFPRAELAMIDMTVRMYTEPSFILDPTKIARELELVASAQERMLAAANCSLEDLRSDAKMAELLTVRGVVPPVKLSVKRTAKAGKPVYVPAFAKSDPDFKALLTHPDELVAAAVEARIGLKSTIKESRAGRFNGIQRRMGKFPVALTYAGAATGRYSANKDDKVNCQNLPAVRGKDTPDAALLRKSLTAPPGYVVVVCDASQIEARVVAWLAGETALVEAFAAKRDVYCEMASMLFGFKVDPEVDVSHKKLRLVGKVVTLGCGYGLGFTTFGKNMYAGFMGNPSTLFGMDMVDVLGVNLPKFRDFISDKPELLDKIAEAKPLAVIDEDWAVHMAVCLRIITEYRKKNPNIKRLWGTAERWLDIILNGGEIQHRCLTISKGQIGLPSGLSIKYKEMELKDGSYSYVRRKEGRIMRSGTYGGGLVENCSQGVAGCVVKEAMVRMYCEGMRPILQVHDEIVVMAKAEEAEATRKRMVEIMSMSPSWAPDLPLAAEGDYASSYGEAK